MTPVLVDTSVWRKYFAGVPAAWPLAALLDEDGAVITHSFVMGELVLGGLSERQEELFARLPRAATVSDAEALALVRRRRLARRRIGWVDVHLLASALTASARLWSLDAPLAAAAAELHVGYAPFS